MIRLLTILWAALPLLAADHYVRSAASGTGTGADWTNAYTDLPATMTRGDTYYVACGAYSGTTHYEFDDAVSGTTLITVKGATASDHGSETGWSSGYGVGSSCQAVWPRWVLRTGYWVLDGNTHSSLTSGHGFKVDIMLDTDVGCTGAPCHNILFGNASTINTVEIRNVELSGHGQGDTSREVDGIKTDPTTGDSLNLTFAYLYIHDFGCGTPYQIGSPTRNILIEYNHIARNTSDPTCHGEALSMESIDDITVRYSIFEDIVGTGNIVYLEAGTSNRGYFYGNVFFHTTNLGTTNNDGVLACINSQVCNDVVFYNNTVAGFNCHVGWNQSGAGSEVAIQNNIFWNCSNAVHTGDAKVTSDYNTYKTGDSYTAETHSQEVASSLFLGSANFRLTSNTAAWTALSTPYDVDMDGRTRTSSRGAYQYGNRTTLRGTVRGATIK